MNVFKTIALLSIVLVARGAAEEGFVSIFNGKDLSGWEVLQGTADYSVVDGSIVGTTADGSPNSFLCSKKHYFDFDLRFEVKLDNDELNSGCQIRSNASVDYRSGLVHGYQVEIEPGGTAGFIYDEGRRGWLSHKRSDPAKNAAYKRGQWNAYRVVCRGDTIKTWVNDVPIADIVDGQTHSGFIGLQVHSVPGDPKWKVRWKNIRIREFPVEMQALVDGKSLTNIVTTGNWIPQGEGLLLLVPRPGESGWARWSSYLWAKKRYGNFLCSFDFKYQKGGNSGFYFHVGDKNNPVNTGIEIQINDVHGWPEPISHHELGGVLLTRGPAKNMAKPAGEWNTMVVSCEGGHLKVWVNDVLVQNMFLDQTVVNGRPAKGYLGFQDHGLAFELRHIKIKEGAEILEAVSIGKKVTVSGEWVGRERELSRTHVTDDNFGSVWAAPEGSRDGWVEIDLGEEKKVLRALLDDTPYSRTRKFALQAKSGNHWETIISGTTIGARKQLSFDPIVARHFRLQIQEAVDVPTIAEFQLFESPALQN